VGQGPGLSRAGSGDDEDGTVGLPNGLGLDGIQVLKQGDRARCHAYDCRGRPRRSVRYHEWLGGGHAGVCRLRLAASDVLPKVRWPDVLGTPGNGSAGRALVISPETVAPTSSTCSRKLGVNSRAQAVAAAHPPRAGRKRRDHAFSPQLDHADPDLGL